MLLSASTSAAPVLPHTPMLSKHLGLLTRISMACRTTTKCLAQTDLLGHVYDNINMVFKIAEQILGRTDSQENGTCATVFPLFEASDKDMKTKDLLASQESAPPLSIRDIILTSEEEMFLHTCLIHTITCIIVKFGGPAFACFDEDVAASTPITSKQIPIHKMETYPLSAMNIDKSSRMGNAEVIDTIFKEFGYIAANKKSHGKVKIIHGDQLSVSRIRSIMANRVGHDSIDSSYLNVVCGPGLFHAQLHAVFGTLQTH
ncbi:hypothetical protein EW026_g4668 [Hermanssonia centrifuga]|uniref:DUF6589 domain-containing protein n=1 Tax=Hermanssonia centrifuga TaxID=98765 RepID=A0A4S4KGD6_9APHY|nr:hypothetical protein EW026_g4668 [Hermanssonia centrifuga]